MKQQISELKHELKKEKNIIKIANTYYVKEENGELKGPYCMRCYDKDKKLINYRFGKYNGEKRVICPVCEFLTYTYDEVTKDRI